MIDSINFLPTALCNLPKRFGFTKFPKGYFPHLYNTKAKQQVILRHLPHVKYCNPDDMKPNAGEVFLKWHENNKKSSFNLQDELLKYCKSDVDILRRASLKFRKLFMQMSDGIDPFANCITIAAACNLVFRAKFLEPETIALIPPMNTAQKTNNLQKRYNGSTMLLIPKDTRYNMHIMVAK